MRKVDDYIMISDADEMIMHCNVCDKLDVGYELYGNPFVMKNGNICQTMIKYKDKESE